MKATRGYCLPKMDYYEYRRIQIVFELLKKQFPRAETALNFADPYQLFVATMLSAQTTDEQVNRITPKLFQRASTLKELSQMDRAELEQYLHGCGLFRNKSRYLIEASHIILQKHGGQVPDRYEQLTALPGVGRKTANVILNIAFRKPALAVDTHIFRVARRLGLAFSKKAEQVEEELKQLLPPQEWGAAHHRLIAHGRKVCKARRPLCHECNLHQYCPSKVQYIN